MGFVRLRLPVLHEFSILRINKVELNAAKFAKKIVKKEVEKLAVD